MAAHEEKPWPPTGINLSAYRDLAVAADMLAKSVREQDSFAEEIELRTSEALAFQELDSSAASGYVRLVDV